MAVLMSASECESNTNDSNNQLAAKQENMMREANAQVGMPTIINFQERKMAKMILEMRDRTDLICYVYTVSEMTGKPTFIGKCLGFGLPYSTQYTNPEKIAESNTNYGYAILPQADPNMLFMPESAEGTWLLLINPKTNEPEPVYCEPKVMVSPFPLY